MGATIILGDRDVDVTLQHLTTALSKTDLKKLFSATDIEEFEAKLPSNVREKVNGGGELDKEQMTMFVESMKQKQTVVELMNRLVSTLYVFVPSASLCLDLYNLCLTFDNF